MRSFAAPTFTLAVSIGEGSPGRGALGDHRQVAPRARFRRTIALAPGADRTRTCSPMRAGGQSPDAWEFAYEDPCKLRRGRTAARTTRAERQIQNRPFLCPAATYLRLRHGEHRAVVGDAAEMPPELREHSARALGELTRCTTPNGPIGARATSWSRVKATWRADR